MRWPLFSHHALHQGANHVGIKAHPSLDTVCSDPRFSAILKKTSLDG